MSKQKNWRRWFWGRMGRNQRGMTLIEIMVVITILGLIMGVVGISVVSYLKDAERETARLQIRNFKVAISRYRQKAGEYPNSLEDIANYMDNKKIPKDPWSEDFIYLRRDDGYDLYSKGPDKQAGSDDDVRASKK